MNLSWPAVFITKPTSSMLFIEVLYSLNSGTLSSYFKIVFQWDPRPHAVTKVTSTVLRKVLWNLIYHFGLFTSPCFNEWINEPQIQLREKKMHKVGMIFKRFIQYNFYFFIHKTSILMTLQIKCFNVLIVIIYLFSLICIYIKCTKCTPGIYMGCKGEVLEK